MDSSSQAQSPRLPLEVFYAALDELVQEDRRNQIHYRNLTLSNPAVETPDCLSSNLTAVCKAWYCYLVAHRWQSIKLDCYQSNLSENGAVSEKERHSRHRVSNLLDCLRANPQLVTLVQNFKLSVGCEDVYAYRDDSDLAAVCGILGGIPQLSLKIDMGVFNPFRPEDSHSLTRSLLRICSSSTLTSLTIYGPTLPLHLFSFVPALREAAFGQIKAVIPGTWGPQSTDPSKALPFRLRKVTFFPGDVALNVFVIRAPEVFQELEELHYSRQQSKIFPFHSLLRIVKGTLKILEIRPLIGTMDHLAELFHIARSPSIRLSSLTELRLEFGVHILSCLLTLHDSFYAGASPVRAFTFNVQVVEPTFLATLRHFSLTLSLNGITQAQWDDEVKEMLFNPESMLWRTILRLFGPEICPSLRELDIEVLWYEPQDGVSSISPPYFGWDLDNLQVSLNRCSPHWSRDSRDVRTRLLFSGATVVTR